MSVQCRWYVVVSRSPQVNKLCLLNCHLFLVFFVCVINFLAALNTSWIAMNHFHHCVMNFLAAPDSPLIAMNYFHWSIMNFMAALDSDHFHQVLMYHGRWVDSSRLLFNSHESFSLMHHEFSCSSRLLFNIHEPFSLMHNEFPGSSRILSETHDQCCQCVEYWPSLC